MSSIKNKLNVLLFLSVLPIFQTIAIESPKGVNNKSETQYEECGLRRSKDRIHGGSATDISNYPWQVSLQLEGWHFCGGSIIRPKWVLTAAHCVDWIYSVDELEVIVGTSTPETTTDSSHRFKVSKIVVNPFYDYYELHNDMALIELQTPIPMNKPCLPVNSICLPDSPNPVIAHNLTTTGWGITEDGWPSEQLMFVHVPFVPYEQCEKAYGDLLHRDSMICAGEKGKDSCQGDSGGGLIQWDHEGRYTIVGIVSFGVGCAEEGYPGVYTRVDAFIDWIHSVINYQ